MRQHILVVGAGSVGRRHLRNFSALGCEVSAVDPRPDRLDEAAAAVSLAGAFSGIGEALQHARTYAGVVVASPPRFHVEQAMAALQRKLPVFLEKPVSPDFASADRLRSAVRETGTPLLLGYTYRWWPAVRELKRRLEAGAVGRPLHVRCNLSAHLADWHPWERYQDFFMASRELGGGALLDESHFLDLVLWFFGSPRELFARVERISSLEIECDDNVDAWLSYANGLRVWLHLDLYGRPHDRSISVTGESGTLEWSFQPNRLRAASDAGGAWTETNFTGERNDMFVDAAREFLNLSSNSGPASCTIEDGCAVLRVIEAMRESSASGRLIQFS